MMGKIDKLKSQTKDLCMAHDELLAELEKFVCLLHLESEKQDKATHTAFGIRASPPKNNEDKKWGFSNWSSTAVMAKDTQDHCNVLSHKDSCIKVQGEDGAQKCNFNQQALHKMIHNCHMSHLCDNTGWLA